MLLLRFPCRDFRSQIPILFFQARDCLVCLDHVEGELLDLREELHLYVARADSVLVNLLRRGEFWQMVVTCDITGQLSRVRSGYSFWNT